MNKIEIKRCSKCGTQIWFHMTTDNPKGPFIPRHAYCNDSKGCGMLFSMEEYKELEEWKEESAFDKLDRLATERTMRGANNGQTL